MVTDLDAM